MSATLLNVSQSCRACGKALTLDEMHYLADGNGTATCCECEGKWMEAIRTWRASDDDTAMPERP